MIGISISLYDRFQELSILVDIIRENWEEEYYITVCSNHPEAEDRIAELNLDLDQFVEGDAITYDPSMKGIREQVNMISRVYDTIRKACTAAMEPEIVSHVMHLHADAWPLSEERLYRLVDEMDERDQPVAFKGYGLGRRGVFPIGHVMDQYFVLDTEYAQEIGFFGHSVFELLPDRGIHTVMMLILLGKVGWSNVYFYSDGSEQVYWDGKRSFGVNPMMYNPDWEYVHIKRDDFPADLGKTLQAVYLAEHGITDGPHIKSLLERYNVSREALVSRLKDLEEMYDEKLGWYGLSVASDFNRNFGNVDGFLSQSRFDRLKAAAGKHSLKASQAFEDVKDRIGRVLGITTGLPASDPVADAWPEGNLDEVYREAVVQTDFPDNYHNEFWFD